MFASLDFKAPHLTETRQANEAVAKQLENLHYKSSKWMLKKRIFVDQARNQETPCSINFSRNMRIQSKRVPQLAPLD